MVEINTKRPRGRPRAFDLVEVLDRAVPVFWELGYEGADTETLAAAMGLTKPSIYAAFGVKEDLFARVLERYGETVGAAPVEALSSAPTAREGILAFFQTIARNVSGVMRPSGCLFACVGLPAAGRMPTVASLLATSLQSAENQIVAFLDRHAGPNDLPAVFRSQRCASMMIDLMLAMGLRGRAGATPAKLEELARRNTKLALLAGGAD